LKVARAPLQADNKDTVAETTGGVRCLGQAVFYRLS